TNRFQHACHTAISLTNENKATHIYNAISGQQQTDFNTPVIQQYR
ncbi:hypothetical protein ACEZDI_11615, partial [Staphylococcus aureus]